jgi:transposase
MCLTARRGFPPLVAGAPWAAADISDSGPSENEDSLKVENRMIAPRRKFAQEFEDELCREVINTSKPIKDVADAYGVGLETLRNWLNKHREANGGTETELTVPERVRLKELEREVQELKAEAQFLKEAAAYFAREQR